MNSPGDTSRLHFVSEVNIFEKKNQIFLLSLNRLLRKGHDCQEPTPQRNKLGVQVLRFAFSEEIGKQSYIGIGRK